MLVVERHRKIAALVRRDQSVRVKRLAEQFAVTEETIRRDLEKLESVGLVVRSHGGAVAATLPANEIHYAQRAVSNIDEKRAIARFVLGEIVEHDTILIDASTTALEIAKILPNIALTVLTNSIQVCSSLAERSNIAVMCIGGAMSSASMSFVGSRAEQHLDGFHVHRFFFSCSAVDFDFGLSDINESQAVLKRKMISIADRSYLLFDHSKLGQKALHRFGQIDDVDCIVTTSDLDSVQKEQLAKNAIELHRAQWP